MRHVKTALTAAGLVAALALPLSAQESYRLDGRQVAIYNLAGQVEVVPGSGSQVVVTVTAGGADASRLSVEVGEIRGRTALRVVYPDDRIVYRRDGGGRYQASVRVRSDGTFGGGMGGDQVQIRSSGSGLEAHADLRVEVPAGTAVALHNAVGAAEARGIRGDLVLAVNSGPIRVSDITGNVELDTGSGSVWARGIRGALEVDTGSGSIDLADVEGDHVLLDTGSGGVEVRGIRTGRLEVDTGSGGVELMEVSAPEVTVDTGSGSVQLDLMGSVETLEVDTGSGSVTARLRGGVNAQIEVDTGSGGIDVDFPVEVQTMRRNFFRGRAGNGDGRISIDTGSGSVRLLGG